MPAPYIASSIPPHEVDELHRLMTEEIKEVAVFFMNPEGIITVWNRGAEEMKGYTAEEAIGSHLALLYTDEEKACGSPLKHLEEAKKHGFYRGEGWRKRKDGSLFWARITLTALHDGGGQLVGFSKITVDLTEHKLLEACTKEREETARVLRAARAGTWTWHPDADRIDVCSNFLHLLGHGNAGGEGGTIPLGEWMNFIHPDDRTRLAGHFEKARASCPDAPQVIEARMCRSDGACRWFSIHADWYRDTAEHPYALNGVNIDIQDFKAAGEELRQAVDRLKEADVRKDEFLAMLAHELRNPLAPVRAAADLLQIVKHDEARVHRTSEIIARQVDHMTSLVDDLLDVSRVTRGLVELEKAPLDMRHIVTDAVEQVNPLIQSRRQHLALHLSPIAATVMGDNKRLVQIVANLLNNAAKYTPEGGNIQLKTEVQEETVSLSVIDDGIGMEPGLADRVFELFAQAERTPDRASGGLGLGLALVKSLVELHGGTVKCTSAGLGKGSNFTVCLPLVALRSRHDGVRPSNGPEQAALRPLRIMVVDDNVDAAHMLEMLLEASGHQVVVEHGSRRALARAATEAPDVCLIDIGLPEIDGKELARRLRAQPATAASVLVAISGYGQMHDRAGASAAGFDNYFVKPVDTAKLLSLLTAISSRSSDS